jgi:peptidyl-prolyl cis-trans isomerase SurA
MSDVLSLINHWFLCHSPRPMSIQTKISALALLGVCSAMGASFAQPINPALPMEGYAAAVNARYITIGEVMSSVAEAEDRLRTRYSGADLESQRRELFLSGLERLIERALIIEEFGKQEAVIPDRAIDDQVNEVARDRFGGDVSKLLDALAEEQITLDDFRTTLRERLIVASMRRREVGDRIIISPRQLREVYEARQNVYQEPARTKVSLIYIRIGEDAEAAHEEALAVKKRISDGESFAEVAKEISDDFSAALGGDWGWVDPTTLRSELKDALAQLPAGGTSEVIYTPDGYYLLQVVERREASVKSFEAVRKEIETELREKEADRMYREWMQRLRNKNSILYFIPAPPPPP